MAFFEYGRRPCGDGPIAPYALVGAAGVLAAASVGLLFNRVSWLVIGAIIGGASYLCLFWTWGLFDLGEVEDVSPPSPAPQSREIEDSPFAPPAPPQVLTEDVAVADGGGGGAFFAGAEWQRRFAKRRFTGSTFSGTERVRMSNGKALYKVVLRGRPGETMFTTDNGDTVTIEFTH